MQTVFHRKTKDILKHLVGDVGALEVIGVLSEVLFEISDNLSTSQDEKDRLNSAFYESVADRLLNVAD